MFDHPNNDPVLKLTEDQSWTLLEGTQHGRLVGVVGGRPDIFPVNIAVRDRHVFFRQPRHKVGRSGDQRPCSDRG